MEQMTENGIVDESNGVRLYPNVETNGNREDFVPENQWDERKADEDGEKETYDVYKMDDYLLWNKESPEYEYERMYGEFDDEGIEEDRDVPSTATIFAAEKSEEEARDARPDHVLDEIPAEIFNDREEMMKKHKELLAEHLELRRKNRLLETWILKYVKKVEYLNYNN
ncbi:uncharacterized protein LOC109861373 [Pseudomyrmex gracilis]|uniref:uncharacterized protein LOC109861373 n=1 Tax=Pseudomyrmex gracilis TaxID=219809 RepID=UPI000994A7F7|nr:uncharacterized protein LOC109861373 [Pseudomyrmex gracilis]